MARKIQVKLILELREAGMSRNSIASTRNISRHSVSDVFRIADEKGIHFKDVRDLDDLSFNYFSTKNYTNNEFLA